MKDYWKLRAMEFPDALCIQAVQQTDDFEGQVQFVLDRIVS